MLNATARTCGCAPGFLLLGTGACQSPTIGSQCAGKPYIWMTNGTCTAQCGTGFYLDITSNECWQCSPQCTQCTDAKTCLTCSNGFALSLQTFACVCPQGMFTLGGSLHVLPGQSSEQAS